MSCAAVAYAMRNIIITNFCRFDVSCMLSVVAVQSTKISILDCMSERDEGEGRGCVCLALPVGLVSLQQLSIKHESVSLCLLGR